MNIETEMTQSDLICDKMFTSAEINFHNRPCVHSFDHLGRAISFFTIPTLEDLKLVLFEANDHGYPIKVTTMGDIESVAYIDWFTSRKPWLSCSHSGFSFSDD